MRLWSLHPTYLDTKGLVALWREGLLARKVLLGETRGYTNHPQLARFKKATDPHAAINAYLRGVVEESEKRGYRFDHTKIDMQATHLPLTVNNGQLEYEREHLLTKLHARDPARIASIPEEVLPHSLFTVTEGSVEEWERM